MYNAQIILYFSTGKLDLEGHQIKLMVQNFPSKWEDATFTSAGFFGGLGSENNHSNLFKYLQISCKTTKNVIIMRKIYHLIMKRIDLFSKTSTIYKIWHVKYNHFSTSLNTEKSRMTFINITW